MRGPVPAIACWTLLSGNCAGFCEPENKIGFVIGFPFRYGQKLYNCAAVITQGRLLGIVPKRTSNYSEFTNCVIFHRAG